MGTEVYLATAMEGKCPWILNICWIMYELWFLLISDGFTSKAANKILILDLNYFITLINFPIYNQFLSSQTWIYQLIIRWLIFKLLKSGEEKEWVGRGKHFEEKKKII